MRAFLHDLAENSVAKARGRSGRDVQNVHEHWNALELLPLFRLQFRLQFKVECIIYSRLVGGLVLYELFFPIHRFMANSFPIQWFVAKLRADLH